MATWDSSEELSSWTGAEVDGWVKHAKPIWKSGEDDPHTEGEPALNECIEGHDKPEGPRLSPWVWPSPTSAAGDNSSHNPSMSELVIKASKRSGELLPRLQEDDIGVAATVEQGDTLDYVQLNAF